MCEKGVVLSVRNPYGGGTLGCSEDRCGRLFSYFWFACPYCHSSVYNCDITTAGTRQRSYGAGVFIISLFMLLMGLFIKTVLTIV